MPGDTIQNEEIAGEKVTLENPTAEAIQISGEAVQNAGDDRSPAEALSQGISATIDATPEMFATHSTQTLKTLSGMVLPYLWTLGFCGFAGDSRKVVLCHERVHLQRRDYLIKPAALFICCVHWFNPLVWLHFT